MGAVLGLIWAGWLVMISDGMLNGLMVGCLLVAA